MSAYWDSSALIEALQVAAARKRLEAEGGITRPHALAEIYSTLTGGRLGFRCLPDDATRLIDDLAKHLRFVELDAPETLRALARCRRQGVRGGLVHDFLHATAAEKAGAALILTLNQGDFVSFGGTLTIEPP